MSAEQQKQDVQENKQNEKLSSQQKEALELSKVLKMNDKEKKELVELVKSPENQEKIKKLIEGPLLKAVDNILKSKWNNIPSQLLPQERKILEFYCNIFLWESLDSMKEIQDSELFTNIKKREELKGALSWIVQRIKQANTQEKRNTIKEEVDKHTFDKNEIKIIFSELIWIEKSLDQSWKIFVEMIKQSMISGLLKNWYKVDDQWDFNFISNSTWDIREKLSSLHIDKVLGKVLKEDEKWQIRVLDINDSGLNKNSLDTITFWQVIKDIQKDWINEQKFWEFLDKLWKSWKIWENLKNILEPFFILFKSLLGLKLWKDGNEKLNDNSKKIEYLTSMLKRDSNSQTEFFKDIFNIKGEFKDTASQKNQVYIIAVQELLWVEAETKGEWDKKIYVYGDKTIQAVKEIQVKIYWEDKAWETEKFTGKFDEKTATDYLTYLKTGKPIPKPQ